MHTCNPSMWDVEAGKFRVGGRPQLHNEFEASQVYMRHCLKNKQTPNKQTLQKLVHVHLLQIRLSTKFPLYFVLVKISSRSECYSFGYLLCNQLKTMCLLLSKFPGFCSTYLDLTRKTVCL